MKGITKFPFLYWNNKVVRRRPLMMNGVMLDDSNAEAEPHDVQYTDVADLIIDPDTEKIVQISQKALNLLHIQEHARDDLDVFQFINKANYADLKHVFLNMATLDPAIPLPLTLFDLQGQPLFGDVYGSMQNSTGKAYLALHIKNESRQYADSLEPSFYKKVLNGVAVVMILDGNEDIRYVNNRFNQKTGFSASEVLGQSLIYFCQSPCVETYYKSISMKISRGESWCGELQWYSKSGEKLWFDAMIMPYDIRDGKPTRYFCVCKDISQSKSYEEQVKTERRRLQAALDGTRAGMFDWDLETNDITINSQWAEICGYRLEELLPMNFKKFAEFIHSEDAEFIFNTFDDHISGKTDAVDIVYRLKHRNGKFVKVICRGHVFKYSTDGKPKTFIGTHVDVTEKYEKVLEIARIRDNQQALINSTDDLIWSVNRSMLLNTFNHAFIKLVEAESQVRPEMRTSFLDYIAEEFMHKWLKMFDTAIKGTKVCFKHTFEQTGTTYNFTINPVKGDNGKVTGVACFGKNITEMEIYLRTLHEQNEKLKMISWAHCHKVRAPLTKILGLIQLIEHGENAETTLGLIKDSALELDEMIHEIVNHHG